MQPLDQLRQEAQQALAQLAERLERSILTDPRRDRQRRVCRWCGEVFYAIRVDALTCSSACRQARYRHRHGLNPRPKAGRPPTQKRTVRDV
jgi:hypothetical protein